MRPIVLLLTLALAVPATRAYAQAVAPTPLLPSAVVLAEPHATGPAKPASGFGRLLLGEALAVGVSSIGFAENGGRIKAGVFALGGLLLLRDFLEARPVTASRGHAVAIAGLAALAVADLAMERDGASRGTIVAVDLVALHAIALGARDRSPR